MALSNAEKSKALRSRRAKLGLKELRGIWVATDQEKQLKIKIREWLKECHTCGEDYAINYKAGVLLDD